MEDKKFALDT